MTEQEMIDVITAHMEGMTIEAKRKDNINAEWTFTGWGQHAWNFDEFDYRVLVTPEDDIKVKNELLEECLAEFSEWQDYHKSRYGYEDEKTLILINKLKGHLNNV